MITSVVGNFPKVSETTYSTKLIGSISRWERKELGDNGLENVFQEITRAVIEEQDQAGLDLLTDGQIRWDDLVRPVARRLEGAQINGLSRWYNNNVYYRRPVIRGPLSRKGPMLVDDYRFAASCTEKPIKAVLPGPYTFALVSEDRHYRKLRPLVLRLAEILNQEAQALAEAGAPLIQFDEPSVGFQKTDFKLLLEALRVATRHIKTKTAVSTYFGSVNGTLENLQKAPVDIIGLDIVSDSKAFAALKRAKITKELALGCVDGRNTKLESVSDLHAIFDAVKKRLPLDRVTVNPNCGLEFLPHTQALAKVQRLVEAVRAYRN